MYEFLFFIMLVISSVVVYSWSYNRMWFKLHLLFDDANSVNWDCISQLPESWHQNPNLYTKDNFMQKFYTEYSLSSNKVSRYIRILFSLAMSCYVMTIEIVLFYIKTSDNGKQADFITEFIWPMIAFLLSLMLILIQPFCILISILNKFFNDKLDMDRLIIVTTVVIGGLITVLYTINFGPFFFSNNILTRLSIAGLTLMAHLSGIACVSTVYYTSVFLWYRFMDKKHSSIYHSSMLNNFQKQNFLLWSSKETLEQRIQEYEYKSKQLLEGMNRDSDYITSSMKNKYIDILGKYQVNLSRINNSLKQSRNVLIIKRVCGSMFIVYCIHRITFTFLVRLPKILFHFINYPTDYQYDYFKSKTDPLAVTLANILDILLFHFNYQHDLESLKSQISLFLSTSLFIGSISTVYTTISFIMGLLPIRFQAVAMYAMANSVDEEELPSFNNDKNGYSNKNPSMIKNLLVSELTGIYVIATVLMIRSNLPFNISIRLKDLLGEKFTVPNVTIDCWFDEMFAFACISTIVSIKLAESYLKNNKNIITTISTKENRLIN